jgi:hypothetical protein
MNRTPRNLLESQKTTSTHWDCECRSNYIHHKCFSQCTICGTTIEGQPDALRSEVVAKIGETAPLELEFHEVSEAFGEHQGLNADWNCRAWRIGPNFWLLDTEEKGEILIVAVKHGLDPVEINRGPVSQILEIAKRLAKANP